MHLARCLLSSLLLAVLTGGPQMARAQPVEDDGPLRGMVWEAPEALPQALAELRAMRRAGVEAGRTGPIRREALLTLADTLGLAFFQDLPAAYLSASALQDSLEGLERVLGEMLRRARSHPSARHFGLTRFSDVTDPATCAALETLARRVRRQGPPGSRTYYITAFTEADACAEVVDLVLLDVLNRDDPVASLRRWRTAHPDTTGTAVGIGALGTWVDPSAGRGLRVPHSPEAQARYFERHLAELLTDTSAVRPAAIFVYRWRDGAQEGALRRIPPGRRYGLLTAGGEPRPALKVVRGLFTGRQEVFAFPEGQAPRPPVPWLVLLGWGVVALLSVFYASSPRFRRMVPRYFQAHGFYREAVREGRDVLTGASVVLLVAAGLSAGLLFAAWLVVVQDTLSFTLLLARLHPAVQAYVLALAARPWMPVLLLAAAYAGLLLLWALLLALASRRHLPLRPGQTLMLIVWPRWPMLLLMGGAVVATTYTQAVAVPLVLVLLGGWALIEVTAFGRALIDYAALTRSPSYAVAALGAASPLALLCTGCTLLIFQYAPELQFWWRIVTDAY